VAFRYERKENWREEQIFGRTIHRCISGSQMIMSCRFEYIINFNNLLFNITIYFSKRGSRYWFAQDTFKYLYSLLHHLPVELRSRSIKANFTVYTFEQIISMQICLSRSALGIIFNFKNISLFRSMDLFTISVSSSRLETASGFDPKLFLRRHFSCISKYYIFPDYPVLILIYYLSVTLLTK
jgi:hypothetical protein